MDIWVIFRTLILVQQTFFFTAHVQNKNVPIYQFRRHMIHYSGISIYYCWNLTASKKKPVIVTWTIFKYLITIYIRGQPQIFLTGPKGFYLFKMSKSAKSYATKISSGYLKRDSPWAELAIHAVLFTWWSLGPGLGTNSATAGGSQWLGKTDSGWEDKIWGQGVSDLGQDIQMLQKTTRYKTLNNMLLMDKTPNFSTWTQNKVHFSLTQSPKCVFMLGNWLILPGDLKLKGMDFAYS